EPDAIRRAEYDQMQAQLRSTFYTFDAAAESILCRRGDLIAVQHDMLMSRAGSARVLGVETDGSGSVTALHLDGVVEVSDAPDMLDTPDLLEEPDVLEMGAETGLAIL